MTSQSPRIFTYKITFEEVPYYYYGVHREKKYDEYYMGSPVTHKWVWDFYTPKKQILEIFPYSDDGYNKAQKVEKRIIKTVYNTDKWCLNENIGGFISLDIMRKIGEKNKELKRGIFALSRQERIENGKIAGKLGAERCKELGVGVFSFTKEQLSDYGKKGGSVSGKITYQNKTGIFSLTPEQKSELSKRNNAQRWECCETGYQSTAAGVVNYQKARGIDTSKSNRRRIS